MRVHTSVRLALFVSLLIAVLALLPSAQALGLPRSPQEPAVHAQDPGEKQHAQIPLLDGAFTIRSQLDGQLPPARTTPGTSSSPQPVSAFSLQQTLIAVADACIMQGRPSLNLGRTEDMWVGFDDSADPPTAPARVVRSLIRFDLPSLGPDLVIDEAELRVFLINSWDYRGATRTVTAYRIPTSWPEMSVSWSNAPSPADEYGSAGVTHSDWGWYEFDVTALVQAWYDGTQPNAGIMLRGEEDEDSGRRGFSTREGPYPPELVIEFHTGQTTATPTGTATATRPAQATPTPTRTGTTTRTPTRTATATRPPASFSAYLPMVLKDFWRQGPVRTPTPTTTRPPIATATPTTPPAGEGIYVGTTNQGKSIVVHVRSDRSAVTEVELDYAVSCGGISRNGKTTVSSLGWSITNRAFHIESDCSFDLSGTFDASWQSVSGTWQGIICEPYGWPREEICRGPIGSWSATRQ